MSNKDWIKLIKENKEDIDENDYVAWAEMLIGVVLEWIEE